MNKKPYIVPTAEKGEYFHRANKYAAPILFACEWVASLYELHLKATDNNPQEYSCFSKSLAYWKEERLPMAYQSAEKAWQTTFGENFLLYRITDYSHSGETYHLTHGIFLNGRNIEVSEDDTEQNKKVSIKKLGIK